MPQTIQRASADLIDVVMLSRGRRLVARLARGQATTRRQLSDVQGMRAEYHAGSLDEKSCGDDPFGLFAEWFDAGVKLVPRGAPQGETFST